MLKVAVCKKHAKFTSERNINMKKTLSLILAGLLVASTVLTGCTTNKKVETTETEIEGVEGPKYGTTTYYVVPEEQLAGTVEFNTEFENKIAEVVAKGDLDNEILLNIGGIPVSAATLRYAVIACNSSTEGTEEEKEEDINSYFRANAYIVNKAIEMGITLSDEDFTTNFTDLYAQFKEQFGDDLESVIEEYTLQTPYLYFLNTYYNLLYSKIYEQLTSGDEFKASVKAATLEQMLTSETPYVRAKHILISFPEGEGEEGALTDAQKQATLDKANEVLALAKAEGADFDALVAEYGEDPGMSTYTGGYYFTTGMMVPEFEETSFALEEGAISDLVETTYGYHIIQRLPLDDDAITASDEYNTKSGEEFEKILDLDNNAAKLKIYCSENLEARYNDFLKEFEEKMNPAEEETTEVTEEVEVTEEAEVEVTEEAEAEVTEETAEEVAE